METGKSEIKVPVNSMCGEDTLPGSSRTIFSLCPHVTEGVRGLPGVSFRALIQLMKTLPSQHNHLPNVLPAIMIKMGAITSTYGFRNVHKCPFNNR